MTAAGFSACGITAKPLLAAIRARFLDCCGDQPSEVRRCGDTKCANWPYRIGTNPFRQRELSEEQRAAIGERLRQG
jgi:hypothetical protein